MRIILISLGILLFFSTTMHSQNCSTMNLQFKSNIVSACTTNTMSMMQDANGLPFLYVANKEAGLTIYNVLNPSNPQLVASVPISLLGNHDVMNVSQQGDFLYLAIGNHFSFLFAPPDSSGMAIVNVNNPIQPIVTDYWVFNGPVSGSGIAVADGDFAYLGAMTNGLMILNVADKSNITLESQFLPDINFPDPNPANPNKYNARGLEVKDDVVYLCFDAGGLRIVNVTDKSNPVETGRYANPALNGLPRAYNNIVVDSPFVYVAVDYCGLEVLDVSDTSSIVMEGQWNPYNCQSNPFNWFTSPGHSNEIRYDPDCRLAFLSTGKSELHVVDLSNPSNPDSCNYFGSTSDSLGTWGVNIHQGRVYLSYICTLTNIPFLGIWSGIKIFEYATCTSSTNQQIPALNTILQNPVHDILDLKNFAGRYSFLYITDIHGRLVGSMSLNSNNHEYQLQDLENGIYFIHLQNDKTQFTAKFVKM